MAEALPTLSVDGFTHNKQLILIKLFEHFLSSNYSQSDTFKGSIGSMKYLIDQHKDIEDLRTDLVAVLEQMYSYYFNTTQVIIDIITGTTTAEDKLNIDIVCTDINGATYTLTREIYDVYNNLLTYDIQQEEIHK